MAVSGSRAARVVNAFCALDLHPSAFPVGMCTRTMLGKAEIILWRTEADTFRIDVHTIRSRRKSGPVSRKRGESSWPDTRLLSLRAQRSKLPPVMRAQVGRGLLRRARNDSVNRKQAPEETMDFKGKVALITGAGNGIGRAAALGFAQGGAKVVAVDRDTAGGEGTVGIIRQQGGEAMFVAADVTKSADVQGYVKAALDAYGSIDCFHNNAGIEGIVAPTAEYDEAMFDTVMAVNVKGVFLGLRHVLPVMLKQKRSAVVNMASVAGLVASPRNAGLCRIEARGDRPHQDRGGRSGACGHSRERRMPRPDRHTHDPLAGIDAELQPDPVQRR